ncbi:MAG TPA: TonB-dependent receptor [Vicinamibacterales bacterium]|nr:TonB-dependent receptor [Vicinamibacterales bacterium]
MNTIRTRALLWIVAAISAAGLLDPLGAQQPPASCTVAGRITTGTTPLPGVSVVARAGTRVVAATSSEIDGRYELLLPAGAFTLRAELTGFAPVEREYTVAGDPCAAEPLDVQMSLAPRIPRGPSAAAAAGRGRFETLNLQTQQAAAVGDAAPPDRDALDAATRLLLPPGFSVDGPTESLAVAGNMTSLDRGMLGDRFDAIARGEVDPVTGEVVQGFGPGGRGGDAAEGRGGPGGRGRGGFQGGPGGRGGPGDFMLGGRGGRQNAYTVQATYGYGGSALDSAPYQLRPDGPSRITPYNRNSFGVTGGGPVRLPGYNGQRRTTFTASYNGSRADELFDQYATVPDEAMRSGDFSALGVTIVDPLTGQPFPGGRIPAARLSPSALALLRFIPLPNIAGSARNFQYTTTTDTAADNAQVRVTHNFTPGVAGRGGPGGRGGGFMGGRGGRGGPQALQSTSVVMNAQVQYRRTSNEQNNVFPTLGGTGGGSTLSTPVALNVMRRRTLHALNVAFTRTTARSQGRYAFVEDVAREAGIAGVAADPFAWGVPTLSFSSLTGVRDVTPNDRQDTRLTLGYTLSRPWRTSHTLRVGGDIRVDWVRSRTDANARGAYTFTGLYTSGGSLAARGGGFDFADFLLGLPQQAAVQYGPGTVRMTGRSMSLFVQDDWRTSASLTFNLGLRYERLRPFTEANGRMVNLDVAPGFTAAVPVFAGGSGPFTGRFPPALIRTDGNNIAPRLGVAWRARPGTIVRGGYGISYNSGSYASIARQMVSQPPFAVSDTRIGTRAAALTLEDAFAGTPAAAITNNYGVDPEYALGLVQTWNADVSRDFRQVWNVGAGYTHTRGSSLDIVRAPNRGPEGPRIHGVQPFLWQTSDGSSVLNAVALRARRRAARGIGGGVTYTLAKSRDNASTIGGGGTVVAQDDQNLDAEWGLSSFDRRHQFTADMTAELPFGENRPWLNGGGAWARLLENWRAAATFTWQSGTPYTPRVQAAASDVARGTSGTLRANYDGSAVRVSDPTIDRFFNTAAFTVPAAGTFGSAGRNMIIGPGTRQLDAQLSRDARLGARRVLTIDLSASNLLNTVNYAAIDTVVNSPTFGQVLSVRPMRSMRIGARFRF